MLPGWLCQSGLQDHLHSVPGALLVSLPMIFRPYHCIWLLYALPPSRWGHSKDLPCLSCNMVSGRVILRNQGSIFESLRRTECSPVSFPFSTPPLLSPQQDSFAPMQIKSKQILGRGDPTNSTSIKIQALNANGFFRVGIAMEPFYHHVWAPYFLHSSMKEGKMLLLNSRLCHNL